jgi:lysylphosphatidylglycerol synthetase-like protein (DUF2156 family)
MRGWLFLLLLAFMAAWLLGAFNWMDRNRMRLMKTDPFNDKNYDLLPTVRLGYAVPLIISIIALVVGK